MKPTLAVREGPLSARAALPLMIGVALAIGCGARDHSWRRDIPSGCWKFRETAKIASDKIHEVLPTQLDTARELLADTSRLAVTAAQAELLTGEPIEAGRAETPYLVRGVYRVRTSPPGDVSIWRCEDGLAVYQWGMSHRLSRMRPMPLVVILNSEPSDVFPTCHVVS
jgi:hypothetical protein